MILCYLCYNSIAFFFIKSFNPFPIGSLQSNVNNLKKDYHIISMPSQSNKILLCEKLLQNLYIYGEHWRTLPVKNRQKICSQFLQCLSQAYETHDSTLIKIYENDFFISQQETLHELRHTLIYGQYIIKTCLSALKTKPISISPHTICFNTRFPLGTFLALPDMTMPLFNIVLLVFPLLLSGNTTLLLLPPQAFPLMNYLRYILNYIHFPEHTLYIECLSYSELQQSLNFPYTQGCYIQTNSHAISTAHKQKILVQYIRPNGSYMHPSLKHSLSTFEVLLHLLFQNMFHRATLPILRLQHLYLPRSLVDWFVGHIQNFSFQYPCHTSKEIQLFIQSHTQNKQFLNLNDNFLIFINSNEKIPLHIPSCVIFCKILETTEEFFTVTQNTPYNGFQLLHSSDKEILKLSKNINAGTLYINENILFHPAMILGSQEHSFCSSKEIFHEITVIKSIYQSIKH